MGLRERLTEIARLNLAQDFTALSYAMMIDGKLWVADAIGTDGSAENRPVTTEHTFNVCSISKVYCTTAMMQLVERGLVELDAPVCGYLPRFTMPDARYRRITVRHLLNHTSGLPGTQWKHFSATHVGAPDNGAYYDEVYQHLAHSYLKAEPGTVSVYCNDGFTLAEMVVAAVSGMPFGAYCKRYITDPIGADSTRTSTTWTGDHPLVCERKKVREFFYLQGCGGFTTSMIDLCRFGNLFLTENSVISEASKAEMRKPQGKTFLPMDEASRHYGLGWDDVAVQHPDFDLGAHVQNKGGNSFQFTSDLLVVPEYNASLAISMTHDCRIDVHVLLMRLFATAMLEERHINLFRTGTIVPEDFVKRHQGVYLGIGQTDRTHFFGPYLVLSHEPCVGKKRTADAAMRFDGREFITREGERCAFCDFEDRTYLLKTFDGRLCPMAQKAPRFPALSEKWRARIGRQYVAVSLTEQDMVCHEMMTGFTLCTAPDVENSLILAFSIAQEGGFQEEVWVQPLDEDTATGVQDTPHSGSRDLVHPCFFERDGVSYCRVAAYLYRAADTVPDYRGEGFGAPGEENAVYRLREPLEKLPEVPEGRRLMVLDAELAPVWDSQVKKKYEEVREGYLILI